MSPAHLLVEHRASSNFAMAGRFHRYVLLVLLID
jgi:hypothetical protein